MINYTKFKVEAQFDDTSFIVLVKTFFVFI